MTSHAAITEPGPIGPQRLRLIETLRLLLLDLRVLIAIPAATLLVMSITGGIDAGDLRTQGAMFAFLVPGWYFAPRLLRHTDGPAQRFALSVIISSGMHAVLVEVGVRLNAGFDAYYVAFLTFIAAAVFSRSRGIGSESRSRKQLHPLNLFLLAIALVLICLVWRTPFSNDISQFLPQQLDMAERRSLQPSDIGMTAFGLDDPMPRWKAHVWHVWISLLADITRLSVEGVACHWATVPVAVMTLITLGVCVYELASCRPPLWAVVLAVFGPLTLWFRNYNAYNYAYRITNNLCLDKDLALFWLIPAWLWVYFRAVRFGSLPMGVLLLLLTPLTLGLHPMTPTYLLLLSPFAFIISMRLNREGLLRGLAGTVFIVGLFAASWFSGNAQSSHREIERLVQLDADQSLQTGRPLHYWGGHYAAVPEMRIENVTTEWVGSQLRLRRAILTDCSVLLGMPIAIIGWMFLRVVAPGGACLRRDWQPVIAVCAALVTLWIVHWASVILLARAPYLFRGVERLHWFCYVPGLVAFAVCFTQFSRSVAGLFSRWMSPSHARWVVKHAATLLLMAHLAEQCWHIHQQTPTVLAEFRGLNSLWDHFASPEVAYYWVKEQQNKWSPEQPIVPDRPGYLTEDDRVLPLVPLTPSQFHFLRQSIWWPELYAEGHLLATRGDAWLDDWQAYYDSVDTVGDESTDRWIIDNNVSLIVDPRPEAEENLRELGARIGRRVDKVAPGVWRLSPLR